MASSSKVVAVESAVIQEYEINLMSRTALIIIDMQTGMFAGDLLFKMHDGGALLANTSLLVNTARKSDLTVIYIQHCALPGQVLIKGTKAWEIHHDIAPVEGDRIIEKKESSAFIGTELADVLREKNIDTLVMCGMQSEHCVANTSLSALEFRFKVIVASDCHSTFPSEGLTAKEMVNQQNFKLKQQGASVVSVLELTNAMTPENSGDRDVMCSK